MPLFTNLHRARFWCFDDPEPASPTEPPAQAEPAPPAAPQNPQAYLLATATPQEQFSQLINLIYDTLLNHAEAYLAVQAAVRLWRDGPDEKYP